MACARRSSSPRCVPGSKAGVASDPRELWVAKLGEVAYHEATELQARLRDARQTDALPDVLLLLEHPSVYTKGRRTDERELLMGEEWYAAKGIEIAEADRGGQVTYHGPGQLVGYPIVKLSRSSRSTGPGLELDVRTYVGRLEQILVAALADEGVEGAVHEGLTGVWAGDAKIGSIGIHVSRGVTTHGFAINVDNDLDPFGWVVPCGTPDARVTSLSLETGRSDAMTSFTERVAGRFAEAMGQRPRLVSEQRLAEVAAPLASV